MQGAVTWTKNHRSRCFCCQSTGLGEVKELQLKVISYRVCSGRDVFLSFQTARENLMLCMPTYTIRSSLSVGRLTDISNDHCNAITAVMGYNRGLARETRSGSWLQKATTEIFLRHKGAAMIVIVTSAFLQNPTICHVCHAPGRHSLPEWFGKGSGYARLTTRERPNNIINAVYSDPKMNMFYVGGVLFTLLHSDSFAESKFSINYVLKLCHRFPHNPQIN